MFHPLVFPDGIMVGGLTGSFPFFVFFPQSSNYKQYRTKHDLYILNDDVKADRNGAKPPASVCVSITCGTTLNTDHVNTPKPFSCSISIYFIVIC